MKLKLWIVAILCAIGWHCHAQTDKKTVMLGGSLSFGTSTEQSTSLNLNSLAIGPRVGYFFSNNFVAGMEVNYNLSKLKGEWYDYFNENTGIIETGFGFKEENFGLSPFARKYFNVKNNFDFFAQGSLSFQFNSYKNIDDSGYLYRTDYSFKGFGSSLNVGFSFYPTKKLALEFSFPVVRYFNESNTGLNDQRPNSKKFHLVLSNFIPSFGVNVNLY